MKDLVKTSQSPVNIGVKILGGGFVEGWHVREQGEETITKQFSSISQCHKWMSEIILGIANGCRKQKSSAPLPALLYTHIYIYLYVAELLEGSLCYLYIQGRYATPPPPCGTVVLPECHGKQANKTGDIYMYIGVPLQKKLHL